MRWKTADKARADPRAVQSCWNTDTFSHHWELQLCGINVESKPFQLKTTPYIWVEWSCWLMNLDTPLTQLGLRYYKLNMTLMYVWICRLIGTFLILQSCVWILFHAKRDKLPDFYKPAHFVSNGHVRGDNVRPQQLSLYLLYFPTSRGNKERHPKQAGVRTAKFSGFTWGPVYVYRVAFFWKLTYSVWQPADWGVPMSFWRAHHSEALEKKPNPNYTQKETETMPVVQITKVFIYVLFIWDTFGR